MDKPTQEQRKELKRLSKEARVEDWSEIVQSKDEAEMRIREPGSSRSRARRKLHDLPGI